MRTFLLFILFIFSISTIHAQTITVTTDLDSVNENDGLTSLREAILEANATSGVQRIEFDSGYFSEENNRMIHLDTLLILTDPDGTVISAEGAMVTINGDSMTSGPALLLESGNNEIAFLRIKSIPGSAISTDESSSNSIHDNWIWECGMNTQREMQEDGITIEGGSGNQLHANWIWSNYGSAIGAYNSSQTEITGNFLLSNQGDGLTLWEGQGENTITGNLFIENQNGLYIYGKDNSNNMIYENGVGDTAAVVGNTMAERILNESSDLVNEFELVKETEKQDLLQQSEAKRKDEQNKNDYFNSGLENEISEAVLGNYYGIAIMGSSDNQIEHNIINNNYYGVYVEGYQLIENETDTVYAIPEGNIITENIMERNEYATVEFMDVADLTIFQNHMRYTMQGVCGYGLYSINPVAAGLDEDEFGNFTIHSNIINTKTGYGGIDKVDRDDPKTEGVDGDAAIYIYKASSLDIRENQIWRFYGAVTLYDVNNIHLTGNKLEQIENDAIYIYNLDSLWIKQNEIIEIGGDGINVDNGSGADTSGYVMIYDNNLEQFDDNAINLYYLRDIVVEKNNISQGENYGIYSEYVLNNHILYNEISAFEDEGISIYEFENAWIQHNVSRNNHDDDGLTVEYGQYCLIYENTFLENEDNGIYAYDVDSLFVVHNELLSNIESGLYISQGVYSYVYGNDIFGNIIDGIYAYSGDSLMILENTISLNGSNGINYYSESFTHARKNNVFENGRYGIYGSSYGASSILDSNYVANNQNGIFMDDYNGSSELAYNTLYKNSDFGVFAYDSVDASMNYWGHPEGPTVGDSLYPGFFKGDRVGEYVKYMPFLEEAAFVPMIRPVISQVQPEIAPREGSKSGELRGRHLLAGLRILINGEELTEFDHLSTELVYFDIPPGPGGPVEFVIINANGLADTLKGGYMYENNSPLPFELLSPANEAVIRSPMPTFIWQQSDDPDNDAVSYIFAWSESESFEDSLFVTDIADTFYTVEASLEPNSEYFWRIISQDGLGGYSVSETRKFTTDELTSIESSNELPTAFALHTNYPNPFNPETRIRYDLKSQADVELKIYNMLGQLIDVVVKSSQSAGRYVVNFDGSNLASGLYVYVIDIKTGSETFRAHRKMMLIK